MSAKELPRYLKKVSLPGLLLAAGGVEYFVIFIVAGFNTTNYNYVQQTISALGARCQQVRLSTFCSPDNRLVDAAFIALGALALAGLLLMIRKPPSRFWLAGLLFLCITSICAILIGLFPINVDHHVHSIVSDIAFPTGVMGISALVISRRFGIWMGGYSLLTVVVSLVTQIIHFATGDYWRYSGLTERLAAGPLVLWILVFGFYLIAERRIETLEKD